MMSDLDPLAQTQAALPISLIATPREALFTCSPAEQISDVVGRFADYDHIPVTEDGKAQSRFLGMLDAYKFRDAPPVGTVANVYCALGEEHLIGSDAPIIDFIWDGAEHHCRLLVAGKSISGLVTLSDLQALPVRAALFALVTRLELVMTESIKAEFKGHGDQWMARLPLGRQQLLREQIVEAKDADAYVDAILFTQFGDKVTILAKSGRLPASRTQFERDLRSGQKLRDALAHANEYASTRAKALEVCAIVRSILWWIENLRPSTGGDSAGTSCGAG